MSEVLVIRCNTIISTEDLMKIRNIILKQKESGVIVLPAMFEAIVVPNYIEIKFEDKEEE